MITKANTIKKIINKPKIGHMFINFSFNFVLSQLNIIFQFVTLSKQVKSANLPNNLCNSNSRCTTWKNKTAWRLSEISEFQISENMNCRKNQFQAWRSLQCALFSRTILQILCDDESWMISVALKKFSRWTTSKVYWFNLFSCAHKISIKFF